MTKPKRKNQLRICIALDQDLLEQMREFVENNSFQQSTWIRNLIKAAMKKGK